MEAKATGPPPPPAGGAPAVGIAGGCVEVGRGESVGTGEATTRPSTAVAEGRGEADGDPDGSPELAAPPTRAETAGTRRMAPNRARTPRMATSNKGHNLRRSADAAGPSGSDFGLVARAVAGDRGGPARCGGGTRER